METRSVRKRRDSDAESVGSTASEPAVISRSRSTTPFTLRSHCSRHGSMCPEGHGINFHSRLSPSPKRSLKKSPQHKNQDGSSKRRNLFPHVEESDSEGKRKSPASLPVASVKPVSKTSDYSSGEEEAKNGKRSGTPTKKLLPQVPSSSSPRLQWSAEKTDYTYARSYSYRTEVTPERVITMPNISRRPIERTPNGGIFSSPELKAALPVNSSTFSSMASVKLTKYSVTGVSYGTDFDSDTEVEHNSLEAYKLNAPPSGIFYSKTYSVFRTTYRMMREAIFSLTYGIYLIICYSLLFDTIILQSKGVTKLRNMCKQQAKNTGFFVLLFCLAPLCLSAGGLFYSAALHAFNSPVTEKPSSNSDVNTNPIMAEDGNPLPDAAHPTVMGSLPTPSFAAMSKETEEELRWTRAQLTAMLGKVSEFDDKMASMSTLYGSLKAQLLAVEMESKACCDEASQEALNKLVDAKLAAFEASRLTDESQKNSESLADALGRLKAIDVQLEALNKWKQTVDTKSDAVSAELSSIRELVGEETIRVLISNEIEKALNKWVNEARSSWFNEMKEQLVSEINVRIKDLDSKSGRGLSKEEVERLIHTALGLYDSDKTGLADYALEPAGGMVLSTRCTEAYSSHRPRLSIWGFSLWSEPNNPRVVIQPGIVPGQCWSFRGFDGYLVIQLSRRITPTAFTLEHIPRSLAPDGQIDSAPRNFTVYGLSRESDNTGIQLGQYTYDSSGEPLQTFRVQAQNPGTFHIVELRIHSNYGNMNYTCLYRFRVHGQVA